MIYNSLSLTIHIALHSNVVALINLFNVQVVSLQSQLASLREQAAQSLINGSSCSNYAANDDHKPNGRLPSYTPPQDIQSWLQQSESNSCGNMPQYDQNSSTNNVGNMNEIMNFNSIRDNYENSFLKEEDGSFSSFQEGSSYSIDSLDMQMSHNKEWVFQENSEDLHSIAFGYIHH